MQLPDIYQLEHSVRLFRVINLKRLPLSRVSINAWFRSLDDKTIKEQTQINQSEQKPRIFRQKLILHFSVIHGIPKFHDDP